MSTMPMEAGAVMARLGLLAVAVVLAFAVAPSSHSLVPGALASPVVVPPPRGAAVAAAVAAAATAAATAAAAAELQFEVRADPADPGTTEFRHFWELMVGSGHAALTLRADWRAYMRTARAAIGFEYVRFHGIFDDDMSVVLAGAQPGDAPVYSFHNVDLAYDFLLEIGMRPLVELSFMPEQLASNASATMFHYRGGTSPPRDWTAWADLVDAFARHLVARYGIQEVSAWMFEVWNEPNCGFWTGSQADYFHLYNLTARTLKAVSPLLRVGGPATCQSGWLPEFKAYVTEHDVPVDFATTHEYPSDVVPAKRGALRDVVVRAQAQVAPLELMYSEFNSGLYTPGFHDDPHGAAFMVFNAALLQPTGIPLMSFWCVSDVFEEQGFLSAPFHEGYGFQTQHGVAKPVFRAMELLRRSGRTQYAVVARTSQAVAANSTVAVFATDSRDPRPDIDYVYVTNYEVEGRPIKTEHVSLAMPAKRIVAGHEQRLSTAASLTRIDAEHGYAKKAWLAWGSPTYLSAAQVQALRDASQLTSEPVTLSSPPAAPGGQDATLYYSLSVPPLGVAVLALLWEPVV